MNGECVREGINDAMQIYLNVEKVFYYSNLPRGKWSLPVIPAPDKQPDLCR